MRLDYAVFDACGSKEIKGRDNLVQALAFIELKCGVNREDVERAKEELQHAS